MDLHLINMQWLRVSQLCCLSSLLSPLLPVEGSLDLPSDAAPLRPNTFICIENTNRHSQHGKVLIWQPFSGSWLSDLLQHWLRTRLKCSPTIPHRGFCGKKGSRGQHPVLPGDKGALTVRARCWKSDLITSFYRQVRAFFIEDHFFPTQYF